MNQRIEWIDSAKGLGIFLVVLGHALPDKNLTASVIWTFHMPLFFFLSGLTTRPWQAGATVPFFQSLKSLAIPYLFFSIVSIVLWQILFGHLTAPHEWFKLFGEMAYGVGGPDGKMYYNVPLWFFTCLFMIRILFAVVTATLTGIRARMIAVAVLAAIAHTVIFVHFRTLLWNLDVAFVGLVFYMAGFYIGQTVLHQLTSTPVPRGSLGTVCLAVAIAGCLSVTLINGRVDMNGRDFANPLLFYIGAFAGIYVAVAAARALSRFAWIGYLGKASIVIFPVHSLWAEAPHRIFPTLKWYGYRLTHSEVGGAIFVAVIEILLCLPLYFAIMRWAPQMIGITRHKAVVLLPPALQETGVKPHDHLHHGTE